MSTCTQCLRGGAEKFRGRYLCGQCVGRIQAAEKAELEARRAHEQAWAPRDCGFCGVRFTPAKPWAKFCGSACRVRSHRRLKRRQVAV